MMFFLVHLQVVGDAGDGQDAGELHNPPDEQLYGQEGVPSPRTYCRGDEDHHRHIGIEHIGARDVLVIAADAPPLPQQTRYQNRWKDQAYQFAGDEDDAEGDHHKTDQQQGRIYLKGIFDLARIDTQQQRNQDDRQQPEVFHQQSGSHDDEVLMTVILDQAHQDSQRDGCCRPHDRRALLQELQGMEPFGHELEHKQVDADGYQGIEADGDKESEDPVHVPVGMLGRLVGGVFPCHDLLHILPFLLNVTQDLQIRVTAIHEDARLNVIIALLRIVVHVFQALLRHVVVSDVVLHLLGVFFHGTLDDGRQGQTHAAVCLGPLSHDVRRHGLQTVDEAVVTGYLTTGVADELAERELLPLKTLVLLRGLMTGIGQVKQVFLLLGIEHQGILVRLFHGLSQIRKHLLALSPLFSTLVVQFLVVLGQFCA